MIDLKPAAESPQLVLKFLFDSARLGEGDQAAIASYTRLFALRMASNPVARLELKAFADQKETKAKALATLRLTAVRQRLVELGIAPGRIRAETQVLEDGDAGMNRRVEAELSGE